MQRPRHPEPPRPFRRRHPAGQRELIGNASTDRARVGQAPPVAGLRPGSARTPTIRAACPAAAAAWIRSSVAIWSMRAASASRSPVASAATAASVSSPSRASTAASSPVTSAATADTAPKRASGAAVVVMEEMYARAPTRTGPPENRRRRIFGPPLRRRVADGVENRRPRLDVSEADRHHSARWRTRRAEGAWRMTRRSLCSGSRSGSGWVCGPRSVTVASASRVIAALIIVASLVWLSMSVI